VPALGITGTGGAGKSSLTDELVRRFRLDQDDALKLAIISIDPSRKRTGGALLGDRIRMNAIEHPNIFMRSLATRDTGKEVSAALPEVIAATRLAGFDMIIVETSGIGQGDAAIVPFVDVSLYVMTPEFGAASQLEKIDMLDFADFVAINKFDRKGAEDALRDVRKQYQRNRELFNTHRRDAGVRHHGRPLQRRRRDRAVPGHRPGAGGQGPQARQAAPAAGGRQGLQPRPCHRARRAHPLPGRDRRGGARLPQAHPRAVPHRPRAPGPAHLQEALRRLQQGRRLSTS
jgi:Ni2+-binding GTPase involved in maturation of urease and hydrogenase